MGHQPPKGGPETQSRGPWSAILGLVRQNRLEDAPDGELVSRALRGELAAYDVLVARYEAVVYSHCRRLLGHREDAEDGAQEAFVRAWEKLGQCRQPDRPLPWMLSIAHNQAMTMLRRRKNQPTVDEVAHLGGWENGDEMEIGTTATGGEEGPADVTEEELERAVGQLSTDDGALFELRYRSQLSVRDIAEVLQRSENTVKVGLHRLRLRIRQAVEKMRGGQP